MGSECEHFEQAKDVDPNTKGCEECEKERTKNVKKKELHGLQLECVLHVGM